MPKTIQKTETDLKEFEQQARQSAFGILSESLPRPTAKNIKGLEKELETQMREAADALNFELAAELRDKLFELRQMKLK